MKQYADRGNNKHYRKKNLKVSNTKKPKKDLVNIFLFILLFVVIILFIFT